MILKDILWTFKEDLKDIRRYPTIDAGENYSIDYEKYWSKRKGNKKKTTLSLWGKERADLVLDFIEPNSTVMDIGCGDGAVLLYLQDKKNIKGIGVDFHKESIAFLQNEDVDGIVCDISDVEQVKKLPEVDYVIGFEILEHLQVPEELVYLLKQKTRKAMMYSFPNSGYYIHRLRFLFGRFPLQWVVHPGEHVRFWTVRDIKDWTAGINVRLKKLITYQGIPVLKNLIPSLFAAGIIIVIDSDHSKHF